MIKFEATLATALVDILIKLITVLFTQINVTIKMSCEG